MIRIRAGVPRRAPYRERGLSGRRSARRALIGARTAGGAVFFAVGTGLLLHVRQMMLREVRQAREVAGAAQSVLLRPLPRGSTGWPSPPRSSPPTGAPRVGGDLYEVIATEHGVRVVMGDVRGHGLAAIGTVAAVLGSFREAVHDEAELAGVLRRLDRALARHCASGTATPSAAVTDTRSPRSSSPSCSWRSRRDGELRALNCGHPWPYLLGGGRAGAARLRRTPAPARPLPAARRAARRRLRPTPARARPCSSTRTVWRTRRDAQGRFFPLATALTRGGARPADLPAVRTARGVHPHSCATQAAGPRTTSRYWCCATTASSAVLRFSGARGRINPRLRRGARSAPTHPRPTVHPSLRPRSRPRSARPGRRTVRGGADGPAGLLRGISVNRPETLRDSARTPRIRALRSHPV